MIRKIAVVAGGDSGEYEISMNSGKVVYHHLDSLKYEPYFVVIQGSDWFTLSDDGTRYPIHKKNFSFSLRGHTVRFDAVFIAIHGSPGENGILQHYLDNLGIPYTSCDQQVSELTFNKFLCKSQVASFDLVTVARSVLLEQKSSYNPEQMITDLGLPVFVKPNRNGSSVGVSKVKTIPELQPAIETAFLSDTEVLVETFMPGREITCGVLSDHGKIITFPVTEIIPKNEFFDYEAKYTAGKSDEIVPADIPDPIATHCQQVSAALYEKLNCRGVVRFDYILNGKHMSFLEVNTVPGFTEASIVPKMARAYGWSLTKLFGTILENITISK